MLKESIAFVFMNLEPLKIKAVHSLTTTSDSVTDHKTGILHFYFVFVIQVHHSLCYLPDFQLAHSVSCPPPSSSLYGYNCVMCPYLMVLFQICVGCNSSAARLELFPVPGLPQLWSWSCLYLHWNNLKQWLKKIRNTKVCLCGTSLLCLYYVQVSLVRM